MIFQKVPKSVSGWIRKHGIDTPAARPNHVLKCTKCDKRALRCDCANPDFAEVRGGA